MVRDQNQHLWTSSCDWSSRRVYTASPPAIGPHAGYIPPPLLRSAGSITAIRSLLELDSEIQHLQTPVDRIDGIRLHNVTYYYDISNINVSSKPVLRNVNCFVPAGAKVRFPAREHFGGESRANRVRRAGIFPKQEPIA